MCVWHGPVGHLFYHTVPCKIAFQVVCVHALMYLLMFTKLLFRFSPIQAQFLFLFECVCMHVFVWSLKSHLLGVLSAVWECRAFYSYPPASLCLHLLDVEQMDMQSLFVGRWPVTVCCCVASKLCASISFDEPSAASGRRVADIPKRASPTFLPCGSICYTFPLLFYLLMVILHVVNSPCYCSIFLIVLLYRTIFLKLAAAWNSQQ